MVKALLLFGALAPLLTLASAKKKGSKPDKLTAVFNPYSNADCSNPDNRPALTLTENTCVNVPAGFQSFQATITKGTVGDNRQCWVQAWSTLNCSPGVNAAILGHIGVVSGTCLRPFDNEFRAGGSVQIVCVPYAATTYTTMLVMTSQSMAEISMNYVSTSTLTSNMLTTVTELDRQPTVPTAAQLAARATTTTTSTSTSTSTGSTSTTASSSSSTITFTRSKPGLLHPTPSTVVPASSTPRAYIHVDYQMLFEQGQIDAEFYAGKTTILDQDTIDFFGTDADFIDVTARTAGRTPVHVRRVGDGLDDGDMRQLVREALQLLQKSAPSKVQKRDETKEKASTTVQSCPSKPAYIEVISCNHGVLKQKTFKDKDGHLNLDEAMRASRHVLKAAGFGWKRALDRAAVKRDFEGLSILGIDHRNGTNKELFNFDFPDLFDSDSNDEAE